MPKPLDVITNKPSGSMPVAVSVQAIGENHPLPREITAIQRYKWDASGKRGDLQPVEITIPQFQGTIEEAELFCAALRKTLDMAKEQQVTP